MKIVTSKLRDRVISARLADWPRILPSRHRATPADAGFGSSRFSSPTGAFRVLYAADDFSTAFAEAVVHDRFEGKTRRFLYRPHLDQLCVTAISSSRELMLLDLTGARVHTSGQALSEAVYTEMPDVDAILFNSRLTTGGCVAVYDRAFSALSGTPPITLLHSALLPSELARLGITVRRARGFAIPVITNFMDLWGPDWRVISLLRPSVSALGRAASARGRARRVRSARQKRRRPRGARCRSETRMLRRRVASADSGSSGFANLGATARER